MRGLWLFAVGVFLLSWMVPPSILKVQAQKNASEPTSQSEEPLMDLQAFIAAARRHFPGVQAAEARIRAAQAQLDESWVAPFFQGQMTFALALAPEMRGSPIFSPDPQVPVSNPWAPIFQFGLEGIIPIWTFGKIEGTRDAARAALEATRFERQRVEEELIERIRRAYFALALALDLEQLVREAEPRLEEARQELERQIDSNSTAVSPHDKHRLLIALSEFRARAAQVRHIGRMARTALRLLAGIERFRVPDCPIARPAVELLPVERYIEHALAHRPELQALRALLRARRASLEIQRAGFLPDIGLSYLFRTSHAPGITDQTNPFIIDPANYTQIGLGLAVRLSLDLWGNAYRVDRESALFEELEARLREAQIGIELEVEEAHSSLQEAIAREEAYDLARREGRGWFISVSQGLELSASSIQDLVDAGRQYLLARYNHLQAIHDVDTALARLERVSAQRIVKQWEEKCD